MVKGKSLLNYSCHGYDPVEARRGNIGQAKGSNPLAMGLRQVGCLRKASCAVSVQRCPPEQSGVQCCVPEERVCQECTAIRS